MKKKILWLCNTMLPELLHRFATSNVKEGWLIGISNELRKQENIELHYMCPQTKEERIVNLEKNGIFFHCFFSKYDDLYTIKNEVREQIKEIIDYVQPDIIHIFGSEMPHAAACVDCIGEKDKVIVSIQGLVSEYAKHYLDGISRNAYRKGAFIDRKYKTIYTEYVQFCKRIKNEVRVFKSVENVIGRTEWDKACVRKLNKNCRYYDCNETMRNSFYNTRWNFGNVKKYSIYVSQGDYPIKGLHNLIKALPYVVKRFPETKIYVAGSDHFLKQRLPYGRYVAEMIKEKNLDQYIVFVGTLNEVQVCEHLQNAHITVMPSNIENSPNSIGEAMLVGTPVIAAYVGGIPDIVQHGVDGLLYQPNSITMLSYYICKLFQDRTLAEFLSMNGRKRADSLYDREKNLQTLLNIYNRIGRKRT